MLMRILEMVQQPAKSEPPDPEIYARALVRALESAQLNLRHGVTIQPS